jgi:GTP pyrophosphokinase
MEHIHKFQRRINTMSEKKVIQMHNGFNKAEEGAYIKSYMFIKGYAMAKNLRQTLIALAYARRLHDGQYRKDGKPYIIHPLKVCTTLINYGMDDDIVLAASLLHDVIEDCSEKLPMGGKELVIEHGLSQEVLDIIKVLTKQSGLDQYELSIYFKGVRDNPRALLVKLSDRLHNSSTLYTFSLEKMRKYVNETNEFILPMASYGKLYYPQYANAFSILKAGIHSLNHSMEIMLDKFEEHDKEMKQKIEDLEQRLKCVISGGNSSAMNF